MKKLVIASSRRYGQKLKNLSQVMFSLLDPQGFRASFSRIMWLAVMLATGKGIGRVTARSRRYNHILQLTFRVARNHGAGVAVKWLKCNHVALMRFIGGSPLSSLRKIEPGLPLYRLSNGLPVCIGTSDRAAIRKGDHGVIRLYMTIFGTYRILSSPLNPKLNTITDPCGASEEAVSEFSSFLSKRIPAFIQAYELGFWLRPKSGRPPFSTSASPNTHNAQTAWLTEARVVWYSHLRDTMISYAQRAGLTKWIGWLQYCTTVADTHGPLLMNMKRSAVTDFLEVEELGDETVLQEILRPSTPAELAKANAAGRKAAAKKGKKHKPITPYTKEGSGGKPRIIRGSLGQLSFKVEAAGKLRVFAIVDVWTQWLLSGLHESIMSSLSKIPMDGTKDHSACAVRAGLKGKELGAWSVDISSATDRIPITIQKQILNVIFSSNIGDLWSRILTDRDFKINENDHGIPTGSVRYNTGQPMGARSSWPMLALTHHLLVQWAAEQVGILGEGNFFEDYEVIGDDLVIHHYEVYLQYLRNAKALDYGISEAKSLPSPDLGVVELAKKVLIGHVSVSSVAVKQLLAGLRSLSARVQNSLYFANLGLVSGPSSFLGILARSKLDYLQNLQKYSAGKANSIICLLTASLGADRLAESVEFLADSKPQGKEGTGRIPVQRILLFVESLLLDGDPLNPPEFHQVLNAQNIVHALVHSIVGQVERSLKRLSDSHGKHYNHFMVSQLSELAPGSKYTKAALLELLPLASFILRLEEDLPEMEEALATFKLQLEEWALLPATSVLPRMVSLPRVRKVSNEWLKGALELLDRVIELENRASLAVTPRTFVRNHGWLLGVLAPLARAQKAAKVALNIAGRPKSRWIGTW